MIRSLVVVLAGVAALCDGLVMPMRSSVAASGHRWTRSPRRECGAKFGPEAAPLSETDGGEEGGTINLQDERLYEETLTSTKFIQWAGDLSLRWPRVGAFEEGAGSSAAGKIKKGDQLVSVNGEFLVGAHVKEVIGRLAMCRLSNSPVDLVMFRGSSEELEALVTKAAEASGAQVFLGPQRATTATITVLQDGKPDRAVTVPAGTNLRDALVGKGINVYRSMTRWTNCNGKQLCGTCVVQVTDGMDMCSMRSLNEATTLRDNPEDHRISCRTNVHGDVTVRVMTPITETTPS